jgi:hypothetical protein
MKALCSILLMILATSCAANSKETSYQGCTPADLTVRKFLDISLTDSIDFIRWNLVLRDGGYELSCRYGVGKPNTNGFINEQRVAFKGSLVKQDSYYRLLQGNKVLNILEVNLSVLHLLDENKQLLIGNGGFSYALNSKTPEKSVRFNYTSRPGPLPHLMAFQGRTPCKEISGIMGIQTSPECNKKKWYIILFTDSTGKPSYYLQGGRQYRKESMERGRWEIVQKNGRTVYKLSAERYPNPFYLLSAGDSILFFTDAEGNLLVGNEDFSYTLNRTEDREPK